MNSMEWRIKKLENLVVGSLDGYRNLDQFLNSQNADRQHDSICDQLNSVANAYSGFMKTDARKFERFQQLYKKQIELSRRLDDGGLDKDGGAAKAALVLAHEEDLVNYANQLKDLAEKSDKILDVKKWPDSSSFDERLNKLSKITREQHLQSIQLDRRTEELIDIYNDIICSFKDNTLAWNKALEAFENEDVKLDEDE